MSSRVRNVGLCCQNLNSGPGLCRCCFAREHLLARGVAGRLLDCLDECVCHGRPFFCFFFLNKHKNIIFSEEIVLYVNVMDLGDRRVFICEVAGQPKSLV